MELKEVFEPVLNIVKNFQKKEKEPASKQAAKDRLKLVLMQDRASVSPDFFDMMKKELIDVIKKYIEIDEESLDVQLTRGMEVGLEGPALYANIPIKNVKPVAPQGEDGEDSAIMTEERADEVAEEILNQIEEAAKFNAKGTSAPEEFAISSIPTDESMTSKTDELFKFADDGVQAVRAELNLPQETSEVISEEASQEVGATEEIVASTSESEKIETPKTETKKKTASKKSTSKKKKEE